MQFHHSLNQFIRQETRKHIRPNLSNYRLCLNIKGLIMLDFSKLHLIRPQGVDDCNALSCAKETANILMSPPEYKPIVISNANAVHDEEKVLGRAVKNTRETFTDVNTFLTRLKSARPGSIFIIDLEDNTYNIF